MPFHVLGQDLLLVLQLVDEHCVRNHHIASSLLALGEHNLLPFSEHLFLEIFGPSNTAELMTTNQIHRFVLRIIRLKLHVHHSAHVVIFGRCGVVDIRILLYKSLVVIQTYLFPMVVHV